MARSAKLRKVLPVLARMLRRFSPHLREQRGLIGGAMGALFVGVLLRLIEPWPLKYVFDCVIVSDPQPVPGWMGWIKPADLTGLLAGLAIALVVVTALRAVAAYASTVGFALAGNRVLTRVRGELYKHLQGLSLSYHTGAKQGDLVMRVIADVGLIKEVVVTAALPLVASTLVLVGMLAVMLVLDWRLALVSLVVVPLFFLSTTRLSRRIGDAARDQRRREGAMAATAAESIGAIKTIQSLSLEGQFESVFERQNNKSLAEGVKAKRLSVRLERTVDVLIALSTALVLWVGARLVLVGDLTPGDLLVFLSYLKSAFRPVRNFAKYTGRLAKASAAGERVLEVLEQQPEICDRPGAIEAEALGGPIEFIGVDFHYAGQANVLNQINLKINPGETVAIVGQSGSGKSTLASLLPRLYDVSQGQVLVGGRDIRDYTVSSLRSQIGVVLQDTLLFAGTVWENIAFADPDADDDTVLQAVQNAGAHSFIQSLPNGYDTVVGERGTTLSNGQRQRVSITRAALRDSPILILDEPTTALDEQSRAQVAEALKWLSRGRTTLLITHHLALAATADRIVVMEEGRIREQGSHRELLAQGGWYASLCRSQSESFDLHLSKGQEEDRVLAC